MTIWLMPAPEHFEAFFFRCDDDSDLGDVIDALRPLRLYGTLRSAAHIGNDYKVLNGIAAVSVGADRRDDAAPARATWHRSAASCASAPGTAPAGSTAPARRCARPGG